MLLMVLPATALVALCALSLAFGALSVPLDQVWDSLVGHAPSTRIENVVWSVRVPRTALGLAAGAALGLSGALMQALTRNPSPTPECSA